MKTYDELTADFCSQIRALDIIDEQLCGRGL